MFKRLDKSNIPQNVAIIMDGNGRYALKTGLGARWLGHRKGVDALRNVISRAYELGINHLTVFAFSTENWKRAPKEVETIFALLMEFLKNYKAELAGREICVKPIGDVSALPKEIQDELKKVAKATSKNRKMIFNVALNYGGRDEILRACNKAKGKIKTEEGFAKLLDAPELDNVDLVIRTSGEKRISNFLLWQSAYAEFYFTDKLWPAFGKKDLDRAIIEYQKRNRRRGG
ncbi:polyprenyl diphosphate synthase [Treponema sp. R6D11]